MGSLTAAALSAVLQFVAPHLGDDVNKNYTHIVLTESRKRSIDPLLVVALVEHESHWRASNLGP